MRRSSASAGGGRTWSTAWTSGPSLRFTAANTRTRQTAEAFCREKSLRWTADLDEILGDPAIDAVVFATPHTQHPDQVLRAAAAGKHVFVEKPFALTLAEADQMLEAADRAGIVLAVGFNRRFHPSMARLREAVRGGRFGTIITISAEQTALHGLELFRNRVARAARGVAGRRDDRDRRASGRWHDRPVRPDRERLRQGRPPRGEIRR